MAINAEQDLWVSVLLQAITDANGDDRHGVAAKAWLTHSAYREDREYVCLCAGVSLEALALYTRRRMAVEDVIRGLDFEELRKIEDTLFRPPPAGIWVAVKGKCGYCGKKVSARRKWCSNSCGAKAYYHRDKQKALA